VLQHLASLGAASNRGGDRFANLCRMPTVRTDFRFSDIRDKRSAPAAADSLRYQSTVVRADRRAAKELAKVLKNSSRRVNGGMTKSG